MKIRSLTTTFFAALLCASSLSAQKLRDVNDDVYYDGVTTLEVTASKNTLQNNGSQNVEDKTTPYYSDEYVTDEVNYTAQMNRFHNPSGMGYYSPYNYGSGWDDPWYWNSPNSSWGFNNGWGNNYNNNCCNNSWGNGWGNNSYNNGWGYNSYNNGWGYSSYNNRWGSYYYNPYSAYNSYNNGWGNNSWASYDPSTNTRPASSTRVTRTSDGNAGTSRNINNNSYTAPAQNSNSSGNNATYNGNTSNSGTNSNGRRTYNTTQTERSTETRSTPRQSSGSFNTHKSSSNTSSGRRSGR